VPAASKSAVHAELAEMLRNVNVNEFAASVRVYAIKPSGAGAVR
jgi:hypothetical protein